MTDLDQSADVGIVLCNACALAHEQGKLDLSDLVRQALETASAEIGGLRHIAHCPSDADGQTDCPLIKPKHF